MFTNILARVAVSAVVILASAGPTQKCGGDSGPKACDTQFDGVPTVASRPQGTVVRIYTVSVCDVMPQRHVVNLSLEYETGPDQWKPMPTYDGTTFRMCEKIPYPGNNVRCEWYVPCIRGGWYRAKATVTGTDPEGKAFSFTVPERSEEKVTCGPK